MIYATSLRRMQFCNNKKSVLWVSHFIWRFVHRPVSIYALLNRRINLIQTFKNGSLDHKSWNLSPFKIPTPSLVAYFHRSNGYFEIYLPSLTTSPSRHLQSLLWIGKILSFWSKLCKVLQLFSGCNPQKAHDTCSFLRISWTHISWHFLLIIWKLTLNVQTRNFQI